MAFPLHYELKYLMQCSSLLRDFWPENTEDKGKLNERQQFYSFHVKLWPSQLHITLRKQVPTMLKHFQTKTESLLKICHQKEWLLQVKSYRLTEGDVLFQKSEGLLSCGLTCCLVLFCYRKMSTCSWEIKESLWILVHVPQSQ